MAHILVIEDDESTVAVLKDALETEGHIIQAATGAEALVMAQQGGVDLVLLDLIMPIMGGSTIALYLHEHPATRRIPIILVTGVEGVECSARALGIRFVLRKPFDVGALIGMVARVLTETKRDST